MASGWSKERIDLAITLWRQGYSGSKIANHPDIAPRSRASVIGLIFRLRKRGLTIANRPASNRMTRQQQARAKPKPAKPPAAKKPPKFPVHDWSEPIPEIIVPLEERRQVLGTDFTVEHGVRDGQCRYIFGDVRQGDWHFCHHERAFKTSWCITHLKAISQPPESVRQTSQPAHPRQAKLAGVKV